MPTYEYECDAPQHHRFERFQRFSDPPVQECPECGAAVHRVIFPVGLVFRGPGFYRTDNAPKASKGSDNGADGAGEKPATEAKPGGESKAETGAATSSSDA